MKNARAEKNQGLWIATRTEVRNLLGLKEKDFVELEKWAGVSDRKHKEGYTATEFRRIKKRVAELKRNVSL